MPGALKLLSAAGLPTDDLSSAVNLRLWVLEDQDGSVRGVIALQHFGSEALLRSLAVAPEYRERGFGRELVTRLETDARAEGVRKLVLLTQTAAEFFRTLGYEAIDRDVVSDPVRMCEEFRLLCPASALCMSKRLK